jgi:chemotaxis protein methyltransferase CheR
MLATEKKSSIEREFDLTQKHYDLVVKLINQFSGITLADNKFDMVYSRLARRLRALNLTEFDSYLERVKSDVAEKENFINALTTNLTHFFREEHHFDYIEEKLLPGLFKQNKRKIRFWSAGCSTGEEPYTLSMVWNHIKDKPKYIDFKILATDLDTNVLNACRRGVYHIDKLKPIDEQYLKWFKHTSLCKQVERQISPKLRDFIAFKQLNLMENWPMKGKFDLIMCRNVLIYFDKPTQKKLVERFCEHLTDDGHLMLGHSENFNTNNSSLEAKGHTTYQKK